MRAATRSTAQRSTASRGSSAHESRGACAGPSHEAVLARTSGMHSLGKCTEPVKTLLPEDIKEELARKTRELGYGSESEYLRELVIVALRGREFLASLHADRLRGLAQNLPGIGPGAGL
jgi:hypothetical protein